MNLSQNPESICVHLEIPFQVAADFIGKVDDESGRHQVEKLLQDYFFGSSLDAYVCSGSGTIILGKIFILTDCPAATLRELKLFFKVFKMQGKQADFLPYIHIAWLDPDQNLWRTFHPVTTRPFCTFLVDPEQLAAILEKGRAVKE